ncbi:MAG: NSS family neurotransmitter:Na+ symporter, partial [Dokdonia sp.]
SVGAAVGVANLVLFPARVQNYGGIAFVIVFIACTFIYGVPLMIAETALGKSSQSDAVQAFQKIGGKSWGRIGLFGIITTWFILSFYIVVAGWALYYLYLYLFDFQTIFGGNTGALFGKFVTDEKMVVLFSGLAMGATVFVVAQKIKSGIEWVSQRFVPLLIILVITIIVTLPFVEGVHLNYSSMYMDFGKMFTMDANGKFGFVEAMGQAFFSLSLGACGMITYGAHLKRDANVVKNSKLIVHTDTLVALLGALLVIPLFGMNEVLSASPPLVFINLVDAFNHFGEGYAQIIGTAFFLLFNIAILTSSISIMEPSVNFLKNKFDGKRSKYALLIGVFIFLLSLPAIYSIDPSNSKVFTNFLGYGDGVGDNVSMGYFNFVLDFFGTFCLIIGSLLLAIFIRLKWSKEDLMGELSIGGHQFSNRFKNVLYITITWIVPATMGVLILGEILKAGVKFGWVI